MLPTDHGPDRVFPPATGRTTARRNLLLHLIRLANQQGPVEASGFIVNDSYGQGTVYLSALQHIAEILDPSTPASPLDSPDAVTGFLAQLKALWTEVVVGEADPATAGEACAYAHKLIARFPAATAYYVNECAHYLDEAQVAVDLLAHASRFITNMQEGALVGRAHVYALRVLLAQMNSGTARKSAAPAVPTIPAVSPMPCAVVPLPPARPIILTENHRVALEQLAMMGELFYGPRASALPLTLRLFPLLVGPTGAGKTFLVKRTAAQLKATYFKVTRGDWIPRGARSGRPTAFQILDRLLASERLCLHLDECDKWDLDFSREWSAGLGSDLWNTLDGDFQVRDYLGETKFGDQPPPTVPEVEHKIRTGLWIVGSGTWQRVFAQGNRTISFGVNPGADAAPISAGAIAKSGMISPELLLRFNSDLVFLNYPAKSETLGLLRSTGISALADELGSTVAASDVDWGQGGMRALETLATRLTLEKYRRTKSAKSESSC